MAIHPNQQVTLLSGQTTLLHQSSFQAFSVTLTGIAGEFTTIPFKTMKLGRLNKRFFEASTVKLRFFETFVKGQILAKPPEGVASLDIIFELRTGPAA